MAAALGLVTAILTLYISTVQIVISNMLYSDVFVFHIWSVLFCFLLYLPTKVVIAIL